jgi:hypothetical protein
MNLMHALTGGLLGGQAIMSNTNTTNMVSHQGALLGHSEAPRSSSSRTVFNGRINVEKVANGYVINIATQEGKLFDTYIASTIQEVNERIAASMVSFQLENK